MWQAILSVVGAPMIVLVSPVWAIDTPGELAVAAWLTLAVYRVILRSAVIVLTRAAGWDTPHAFGWWLRAPLIPWRWPYRAIVAPLNWFRRQMRSQSRPNAAFESLAGICSRYVCRPGDIPIGLLVWRGKRLLQVLGLPGGRGINLIGAPGSGKSGTFGTILGSLHPGASALFVDAGGEISAALGAHLRATHSFVKIELGIPGSGRWNLLDELAAAEQREGLLGVVKMLKVAAEGLVPVLNDVQPVFELGARDFIAAIIGYTYLFAEAKDKTLSHMRHLLCCGIRHRDPKIDPFDNLLFEMEDCHDPSDDRALLTALIARGAATMRGSNSRDHGNPFLASARRATSWIDIDTSTGGSDFLMAEVQQGNRVVSIVGSVGAIRTTYQPLVRLMLSVLGHVFTSMPRRSGPPSLAFADEAQNLHQLALIESGPHMRKYRLRVLAGWQDLPGMAVYPKTWESILASADANVFFETSDKRTLEWISAALGKTVERTKVEGTHWLLAPFIRPERRVRASYREEIIDLRNPAQVKDALAPGHGRIIVLSANRPFIAASHPYWRALPVWRSVSPGYAEPVLRRIGRGLAALFEGKRREKATLGA